MNKKCEGVCFEEGKCHGELKYVRVTEKHMDWGNFYYCDNAIKTDRDSGFSVRVPESERMYQTIIVNDVEHSYEESTIRYKDIVWLINEYTDYKRKGLYSIVYKDKNSGTRGILSPGKEIRVVDGMRFEGIITDNA